MGSEGWSQVGGCLAEIPKQSTEGEAWVFLTAHAVQDEETETN